MEFYKKILLLLVISMFTIFGCSKDEDEGILSLNVTQFKPSKNEVLLEWKLNLPEGIIMQDLKILRKEKNTEESGNNISEAVVIANLPTTETTYKDLDIPYKLEVTYFVRINYRILNDPELLTYTLDSDEQIYKRDLVLFGKVPVQVQQDPVDSNIFHILDKSGIGFLKQYSSAKKTITQSKKFTNGWQLNNKFHIYNNEVYVASTDGVISKINANSYETTGNYKTETKDILNAFAVDGDRVYYQDRDNWKYYTIATGISNSTSMTLGTIYAETLSDNKILFLYTQGLTIFGFSPEICNTLDCSPDTSYNPPYNAAQSKCKIDPYIFTWQPNKQKFISSYQGWVINFSATVQGEKIIHKFNSNYELVDTIKTKLYPLFPMVTENGLQVVGAYKQVSYWGYFYGYEFNFDVECAIETF